MIRPFEPADAPVVHALLCHALGPRPIEALLDDPPRIQRRVAVDDGAVTGFAEYRVVFDEAELCELAVQPDARRRGVARRLLEHLFTDAAARGAEALFLEVRVSNAPARRLYEATGFDPIGTRRRYYADGEHAALYRRALPRAAAPVGGDP